MNGSNRHAVLASTVFDGTALHQECAVVIEGPCVCGIAARRELPAAMPIRTLPEGAWLAPGFIDVQVNGGGDVLFNDEPTPEGIGAIVAAHRQFGTTALVPTLISDTPAKMRAALDAVRRTTPVNPSVLGIHFEGPFLSPTTPARLRDAGHGASGVHADHLGARAGASRFHGATCQCRRSSVPRALHGDLCANQGALF